MKKKFIKNRNKKKIIIIKHLVEDIWSSSVLRQTKFEWNVNDVGELKT